MRKLENISDFIVYPANRNVRIVLEAETMWSDIASIASLFNTDSETVLNQLEQLYKSKEIQAKETISKDSYYSLYAIVAVGYRIDPKKTTEFNIWANRILRDYLLAEFLGKPKQGAET
ncbi:MAG: RhuM family protein [bacterium]|nr:RhuM family protein [bacterium]